MFLIQTECLRQKYECLSHKEGREKIICSHTCFSTGYTRYTDEQLNGSSLQQSCEFHYMHSVTCRMCMTCALTSLFIVDIVTSSYVPVCFAVLKRHQRCLLLYSDTHFLFLQRLLDNRIADSKLAP